MRRQPQRLALFEPGDPTAGFYNDLTGIAEAHGAAVSARRALREMLKVRHTTNPVSVAQLGLASWQRWRSTDDDSWLAVVEDVADWITSNLDRSGCLPYLFDMPHTYGLTAPWCSAMAQGEAVSLLVRSAAALERSQDLGTAAAAARPLLDPTLGLVVEMPEGPVLQEYPTEPSSHVLNGWIFALWGLYDLSLANATSGEVEEAISQAAGTEFDRGLRSLAARLEAYEVAGGWSRYDLYPHRIVHVASPFYHRLHVAQLHATATLRPDLPELSSRARRWERALRSVPVFAVAVARKVAFRGLEPRR